MMRPAIRNPDLETLMQAALGGRSVTLMVAAPSNDCQQIDAAVSDVLARIEALPTSLQGRARRALRMALGTGRKGYARPDKAETLFKPEAA